MRSLVTKDRRHTFGLPVAAAAARKAEKAGRSNLSQRDKPRRLSWRPLDEPTGKGSRFCIFASNKSTALAEVRAWKGAAVALAEVTIKRHLLIVDLSRSMRFRSPFFLELPKWNVQLASLLRRLGSDLSRPMMPHEEEVLYRPTQLLAWLIRSSGYQGFIYPSAMGPGTNIVLFNPEDAEVAKVSYVRVK